MSGNILLCMLEYILWTQEVYDEAVRRETYTLKYVPDHIRTKEMCERAAEKYPGTLEFVSNHLKTKRMCERAVEDEP